LSRLPPIRRRRDNLRVVFFKPRRRSTSYPNREARFGAKTIAGAGAFRPTDSDGNVYDLTGYSSLVSGSLGSYSPSISGGGLRFTGGGAGAPAGAVLRCAHANGTIDITIGSLIANTYSVSTLTEAGAAYVASALGNTIELRAGDHNSAIARVILGTSAVPSGTWTGTSALSDGNWVTLTRDPGATVTIGAVEVGAGGTANSRYLRFDDLDFVTPPNADSNGLLPSLVNGQLTWNTSCGYMAVTNCRFNSTVAVSGLTSGVPRGMTIGNQANHLWIEGNEFIGCRHGILGGLTDSVVRNNLFRLTLSDCMQINRCNNLILEDNVSTDKCYGYTVLTITAISRGANTVVTFASTSAISVNEPCIFDGLSGALGGQLNGVSIVCASKTATTATFALDTSAMPDWDGVSGTMHALALLHGDHLQFADDPGADNLQDNVTIRGNRFTRGNPGQKYGGSQGLICGGTSRTRSNWLVEGNIMCDGLVNGMIITNPINCTIRSNTVIRQIGWRGGQGGAIATITTTGSSASGNTVVDNIANAYTLSGVTTNDNNATLTLVENAAVPANATDVATYQSAFEDPNVAPDISYDAVAAFATRTDGGSVFPGPIYPGATPYFDYTTLVYTNPR
jgi:hypothetical protein